MSEEVSEFDMESIDGMLRYVYVRGPYQHRNTTYTGTQHTHAHTRTHTHTHIHIPDKNFAKISFHLAINPFFRTRQLQTNKHTKTTNHTQKYIHIRYSTDYNTHTGINSPFLMMVYL